MCLTNWELSVAKLIEALKFSYWKHESTRTAHGAGKIRKPTNMHLFISGPPSLSTVSDQLTQSERTSSPAAKHLSAQTPNQMVGNRSSTNSAEHIDRRHLQASGVTNNSALNHKAKYIESSRNSLDSQSSTSNSDEMKEEPLTFFTAAKFR